MPVDLNGEWQEVEKIGLAPILDELGVPQPIKHVMLEKKISCNISQTGDHMKITANTPRGPKMTEFRVDGTEQDFEDFLQGGTTKSSPHWEDDRLVTEMNMAGKNVKIERYREGDRMIMAMSVSGKISKTYWNRC